MEKEYQKFLSIFAEEIISKNYSKAYDSFSDGLKDSISLDNFKSVIEKNIIEINDEWELENTLEYPEYFEVDGNSSLKLDYFLEEKDNYSLFSSSEKIPSDITKDNYLYWGSISFLVSEKQQGYIDFDGWFDFWCILIKKDDSYKIGYFEIHDLD